MGERNAVRISPAWDDPAAVIELIRSAGPFWPLANYASNDAEMAALRGARKAVFVPPWFRQDFVTEGVAKVEGAESILGNERFIEAAKAIGGESVVVRPTSVYVNIMGPTPFSFQPHIDVPAFRGFTRATYPIWLLKVMRTSELFESWRIKIVTAVSWFYDGEGGDFHYWPDGPEQPSHVESPPFRNVSVAADNESTFHGVAPLGPRGAQMPAGLDSESRLVRGDGGWDIVGGDGSVVSRIADADARITVSWKADVFADDADAAGLDAGDDLLTLDTVVELFLDDLARRGIEVDRPADPVHDEAFAAVLAETYRDLAPALR